MIDSENQIQEIVYMDVHDMSRNDKVFPEPVVRYMITRYTMLPNGILRMYKQSQVTYKLSTWMTLFGGLTAVQIEAQKDQLFIDQIDYVNNTHDWAGNELSIVRYWDTTSADWEIYVPAQP